MADSIRAAAEKLVQLLDAAPETSGAPSDDECIAGVEALDNLRAALAQPEEGVLTDGYHTFAELYDHRHSLMLALMRAVPQLCWFSQRHADGLTPFGTTEWFIAGADLPAGAITYHLPIELLSLAQQTGAAELSVGRPWDGHTANDVIERLRAWATSPQPEGVLTDEELETSFRLWWIERYGSAYCGAVPLVSVMDMEWTRYAALHDRYLEAVLTDEELNALMPQQMRTNLEAAAAARAAELGFNNPSGIFRFSVYKEARAYARAVEAAVIARHPAPESPAEGEQRHPAPEPVAIPGEEYHEDMGAVTWWMFPVNEPPWVGTPNDSDWPGYHTHFTPAPPEPAHALPLPAGEGNND